jgi:enoyl-CoA hydratase
LRIGLVNKVVPQAELMPAAIKAAKKIMAQGPVAVQIAKKAINNGINADIITGLAFESNVFGLCFATADQKEGMKAFMEKRKPEFTGK